MVNTMNSFNFLILLVLFGCCFAAPRPIDWDNVRRKVQEFGDKSINAVRSGCGYINNIPTFPQFPNFQGFQPAYFPPSGRGFPALPSFPTYYPPTRSNPFYPTNYYPNSNSPPNTPRFYPFNPVNPNFNHPTFNPVKPEMVPTTISPEVFESQTTIEQNDLNGSDDIPPFIPPTNDDAEENVNIELTNNSDSYAKGLYKDFNNNRFH